MQNRSAHFENRALGHVGRDDEPQHIGAILAELLGHDCGCFPAAPAPENRVIVAQTPSAAVRGWVSGRIGNAYTANARP